MNEWITAPAEPTEEMLKAGNDWGGHWTGNESQDTEEVRQMWYRMIAAAPKPDDTRTLICPVCGHTVQTDGIGAEYCGPHGDPAHIPAARMIPAPKPGRYVDIVFDAPPGPESGRFVEVENEHGCSINFGEWVERPDGYWVLRIQNPKPGDWVAFYRAGCIVYAQVEYRLKRTGRCDELCTNQGAVPEDCVLEVRRKDAPRGQGNGRN